MRDTLIDIEDAVSDAVEAILSALFKKVLARAVASWPGDDAPLEDQQDVLARLNVDSVAEGVPRVQARIRAGAREAMAHGRSVALTDLSVAGVKASKAPPVAKLPPSILKRIDVLTVVARTKLTKTKVLLKYSTELSDVLEALSVTKQAIDVSTAVARTVTNQASNYAITTVSHEIDSLVSVWRSERDACVHCLAYQGQIDDGEGYPGGLTFGKKALSQDKVAHPPLHPNCRCTQSLVHRDVAGPLATALKREAKRSILRGWSRPSESEGVRIDAAKRLVNKGSTLPKSVREYAERAVKQGRFARGRTPPT